MAVGMLAMGLYLVYMACGGWRGLARALRVLAVRRGGASSPSAWSPSGGWAGVSGPSPR